MERSCERALEIGLPAIAFTEHADWALVHKGQHPVDIGGGLHPGGRRRARVPNPPTLTPPPRGGAPPYPQETAGNPAARPPPPVPRAIPPITVDRGFVDAPP